MIKTWFISCDRADIFENDKDADNGAANDKLSSS